VAVVFAPGFPSRVASSKVPAFSNGEFRFAGKFSQAVVVQRSLLLLLSAYTDTSKDARADFLSRQTT